MKIFIQTQVRENYGAHDWNGEGECPQYWKCKGGNTFVVPNLTVNQVMKIKDKGIPTLKTLIEERNDYYQEDVIDWGIYDNEALVGDEWETPFELFWEQGRWVARRTIANDDHYGYMRREIASKTEQYDMLMDGGRENYSDTYVLRDGRVVNGKNLSAALAA